MQLAIRKAPWPWRSGQSQEATLVDRDADDTIVADFPSLGSAALGKVLLERLSMVVEHVSVVDLDRELRRVCTRDYGTTDYTSIVPSQHKPLIDAVAYEFQKDKADKTLKTFGLRLASSDPRCPWDARYALINRADNELVATFKTREAAAAAKSIIEVCWIFDRRRSAAELDRVVRHVSERVYGTTDYASIARWKTPLLIDAVGQELVSQDVW
ncbi:hypothetical protein [Mycobacterium sp. 94-17]|uniref:hypothetical protein n=1 Tax=Mycobacterium sp. 94-17 TaxID=2986147 RepID=UPI002D1F8966|nr:hypothetical protein [Mycobacterium sp. 94-17]MEB4210971.1 hypothetical protein [Mycobacterium sp. 94-17]